MIVDVDVNVDLIDPVIVAAHVNAPVIVDVIVDVIVIVHVNGNVPVIVILPVDLRSPISDFRSQFWSKPRWAPAALRCRHALVEDRHGDPITITASFPCTCTSTITSTLTFTITSTILPVDLRGHCGDARVS